MHSLRFTLPYWLQVACPFWTEIGDVYRSRGSSIYDKRIWIVKHAMIIYRFHFVIRHAQKYIFLNYSYYVRNLVTIIKFDILCV